MGVSFKDSASSTAAISSSYLTGYILNDRTDGSKGKKRNIHSEAKVRYTPGGGGGRGGRMKKKKKRENAFRAFRERRFIQTISQFASPCKRQPPSLSTFCAPFTREMHLLDGAYIKLETQFTVHEREIQRERERGGGV